MDAAAPGTIGGTYIGSPVSCAAALATIQYMKDHQLNERAIEIGDIISGRFETMKKHFPSIGDVRGVGAMKAMELVKDNDPGKPDSAMCDRIIAGCAEQGLILLSAGTFKNIIRILCPLVITNHQLNKGLDILEKELKKATTKL
jgi:4-aminobutyrate aminotransferase/(S)-3-amino-2-methylpropionate transaminase